MRPAEALGQFYRAATGQLSGKPKGPKVAQLPDSWEPAVIEALETSADDPVIAALEGTGGRSKFANPSLNSDSPIPKAVASSSAEDISTQPEPDQNQPLPESSMTAGDASNLKNLNVQTSDPSMADQGPNFSQTLTSETEVKGTSIQQVTEVDPESETVA